MIAKGILRLSMFALLLSVSLSGCDTNDLQRSSSGQQESKQQKLADLKRQKADAIYEIDLRQDEMKEMETNARKPGIVGVSKQWLERHNHLKEEITKLRVKNHDLDLQIEELAKP
jgi:hypothetical protein